MHKKFGINQTKLKGGCHSGRKVVPHDSKSDLPLACVTGVRGRSRYLLRMEDTNQDVNKNGTIPLGSQGLSALANSLEINATTPLKSSSLQLTFLTNHVEKPPLLLPR